MDQHNYNRTCEMGPFYENPRADSRISPGCKAPTDLSLCCPEVTWTYNRLISVHLILVDTLLGFKKDRQLPIAT